MTEIVIGVVSTSTGYVPARYFQDSVQVLGSETFPTSVEAQRYGQGWHAAEMQRSARETTAAWENLARYSGEGAKSYVPDPPPEDARIKSLEAQVSTLWAEKIMRDVERRFWAQKPTSFKDRISAWARGYE